MRNKGRSWRVHTAILLVLGLLFAACGSGTGTDTTIAGEDTETTTTEGTTETTETGVTTTTDGEAGGGACDGFPTGDIEFVVPYSTGGGFDTWARLLAPQIQRYLPNDVNVVVVNREGAGGLRGVSELFSAAPDGHTIAITEPGVLATSMIAGQTDLDFGQLEGVAQVTVAPEVIVVAGDSEWATIEDVQAAAADGPILSGTGGLAAINIVAFDALGIPLEHVQHDGSSEALLSIVRGDTQITVFPLNSVAEGIIAGDLKPLVVVGSEPSGPDAEVVEGVPLLDDVVGIDGIGPALEQHRILVAPPGTPECALVILSDAVELAFAESEFRAQLEEAGLVPVFMNQEDTDALIDLTIQTLGEYEELLIEQLGG